MSLVWRKIQRSNKKAAKFRFTATFQELSLRCTKKWQPAKLCLAWVHRRRRYATKEHKWEPSITDPYHGLIVWPPNGPPEFLEMITTMYRNAQSDSFDDKEWTFIVEEVTSHNKRKPVAGISLNMRLFTDQSGGSKTELKLKLNPLCDHSIDCRLQLILNCLAIGQEGDAVDDDMQSLASQMSNNNRNNSSLVSPQDASADLDAEFLANFDDSSNSLGSLDRIVRETSDEIRNLIDKFDDDTPVAKIEQPPGSVSDNQLGPFKPTSGLNFKHSPIVNFTPSPGLNNKTREQYADVSPARTPIVALPTDSSTDLMTWCQNATKNYRNVKITDFSSSWRNGLAFCALVHRFRPDLIEFDQLDPSNIFKNCSLAFDVAASLGVAKIISPSDMVVLSIPDKIAVMTYVSLLRDLFTGQLNKLNLAHQADRCSNRITRSADDRFATDFGSNVEKGECLPLTLSADDARKPILMTRNQLMNPFDSDEEISASKTGTKASKLTENNDLPSANSITVSDAEKVTSVREPESAHRDAAQLVNSSKTQNTELAAKPELSSLNNDKPILPTVAGVGFTSTAVASRALKLLEQYEKQQQSSDDPEEVNRKRALKERARKLIEEVKLTSSASNKTDGICKTVKISDVIKSVQYPFPNQSDFRSSSAPPTRQQSPEFASPVGKLTPAAAATPLTKESLQQEAKNVFLAQKSATPVTPNSLTDQFRRFGSMRGQDLARNLNVLSGRIAQTIRSQSTPKDIDLSTPPQQHPKSRVPTLTGSMKFSPNDSPVSILDMDSSVRSRLKLGNSPSGENRLMSRAELGREMDILMAKQQDLDKKATQVERQWRQIMQDASGTDQEQSIMNEYLTLLNERNMLTRREMHLSLLESVGEYEEKFGRVQGELGDLIQIDDHEKTELHKKRIDQLMEELIGIVNKRDELMQQLIEHEQGTEEDAKLADDVMQSAGGTLTHQQQSTLDKDTCAIQ